MFLSKTLSSYVLLERSNRVVLINYLAIVFGGSLIERIPSHVDPCITLAVCDRPFESSYATAAY
jgi:hypothetical protein